MAEIFDLFGDPVPENWGRRGRPQHIATQENRNKVSMLLALGWGNERIASALGVSLPTLRRYYFSQLRLRDAQRDRLDAKMAMTFWAQFVGGNVAAGREFNRLLERNDLALGRGHIAPKPAADQPKEEKLGKKEQLIADAQTAHEDSSWGDILEPSVH